jgi:hypothetical protein
MAQPQPGQSIIGFDLDAIANAGNARLMLGEPFPLFPEKHPGWASTGRWQCYQ